MNIKRFQDIEKLFSRQDVEQIYVKRLARKQDNDKNQIYLGSGLDGVTTIFPAVLQLRSGSTSTTKRHSKVGKYVIEAKIDLFWLQPDGCLSKAPKAKIINYFQYPEVRLSGFLSGCSNPPDCLRRVNQQKYGKRILVLGVSSNKTIGMVINELEDPLVNAFPELPDAQNTKILKLHSINSTIGLTPKDLLVSDLENIVGDTWHESRTLDPKATTWRPFKGNQGAGYTLEALLGIPRNAGKAPDKHGFEIKSFKRSGKISLMTPTADSCEEGILPFREFMGKYGWPGERGNGSRVFNGTHRYQKLSQKSGLELQIRGLDNRNESFLKDTGEILVYLKNPESELKVSGWTFAKLLQSWGKKHNFACYVEYEKQKYTKNDGKHDWEYKFNSNVYLTFGTTIFKYLMAIAKGVVFYDPGHEISAAGKTHVRPQWRINVNKNLSNSLAHLYQDVQEITIQN